jgi:DNA-binding LytR/AlgR family response regulator
MNIKCIIIDDEVLAIEILENYISRIPYLKLCAKFNNGIDALEFIKSNPIDLLFIDIQMPDITGIEFLRLLNKEVNVVFTTAYPEYALEGYDFNPVDYLVKPISFEKFMRAVSRVKIGSVSPPINATLESEFVYIKAKGKSIQLQFSDILFIEGLKDYVIFHTSTGKHISYHGMKELENKLPDNRFVRVHKSFIVAIDKIQEIEGNEIKIGGNKIPVGRHFKSFFQKVIENKRL